jgi:XTP/dITP diphosphohydrolase
MLEVVIATRNHHKAAELQELLRVRGIRWRSLADFPGVTSPRENGRTFDANAVKKARAAAAATGRLALADDSGLEVAALGNAPGIRSARLAGRHGDDEANNQKLLRLLAGVPPSKRAARYRCSLALADPGGVRALTRGIWRGRIAERPVGRRGFGYDPIVLVPKLGKTVAQLSRSTKQRLSHRAIAAGRMRRLLERVVRRSRVTGQGRRAAAGGRGARVLAASGSPGS